MSIWLLCISFMRFVHASIAGLQLGQFTQLETGSMGYCDIGYSFPKDKSSTYKDAATAIKSELSQPRVSSQQSVQNDEEEKKEEEPEPEASGGMSVEKLVNDIILPVPPVSDQLPAFFDDCMADILAQTQLNEYRSDIVDAMIAAAIDVTDSSGVVRYEALGTILRNWMRSQTNMWWANLLNDEKLNVVDLLRIFGTQGSQWLNMPALNDTKIALDLCTADAAEGVNWLQIAIGSGRRRLSSNDLNYNPELINNIVTAMSSCSNVVDSEIADLFRMVAPETYYQAHQQLITAVEQTPTQSPSPSPTKYPTVSAKVVENAQMEHILMRCYLDSNGDEKGMAVGCFHALNHFVQKSSAPLANPFVRVISNGRKFIQ